MIVMAQSSYAKQVVLIHSSNSHGWGSKELQPLLFLARGLVKVCLILLLL